jgi:hypothetical protein
MSDVFEIPPDDDWGGVVPRQYDAKVIECLRCQRDFKIGVPSRELFGALLFVDVLCPHCRRWSAETLVPPTAGRIFVQACRVRWVAWKLRIAGRSLGTALVYTRIWAGWPWRAARRAIRRASERRRAGQ